METGKNINVDFHGYDFDWISENNLSDQQKSIKENCLKEIEAIVIQKLDSKGENELLANVRKELYQNEIIILRR